MKKILYFAAALLTFAACEKEVEAPVEKATPATYKVTIKAGFADETKTAYDTAGKFSWVAGDKIGVMVQKEGELKQVTFTAKSAGAVTEFEGEVEEGWTVAEYASYPFTGVTEGYARNDFAWDKSNGEEYGWRLWGSIKPDLENPLASTPLIAKKDAEGYYSFKTATGILKFTVKNVPLETYYAYLAVPSETKEQYNLNGWYSLNDEGLPTMATAIEPWEDRYNWNAPTDYNQTMDYYFFVPEGTLPVGTKFELCNSSWAAIKSFEVKTAVEVVRNRVTNVAPVEIEAYSPALEENQVWIKAKNIKAADVCTHDGGGIAALVDFDYSTYWHSNWYYAVTGNDSVYGVFFDITLEEALKDFRFEYVVRDANANARPTAIVLGVSNDGENWTKVAELATDEMLNAVAGARVALPDVHADAAYKYLRFGITDSANTDEGSLTGNLNFDGYKKCVNLAELLLFKAGEVTPPEPKNVDVLTNANTINETSTTYKDWTTETFETGATYTGDSAGDASTIQLRSDVKNGLYSGFVSTTTGGLVKKVKVTWNTKTSATRYIEVYGSNTAYTATADLYDLAKRGTLLGVLTYASAEANSAELTVSGEYAYVGVRSRKSAQYLDSVEITWETGTPAAAATPSYNWDFGSAEWQALFAGYGEAGADITGWNIVHDGMQIVSVVDKSKYQTNCFQMGGKVNVTDNIPMDRYFTFTAPKDGYVLVVASNTGETADETRLVTVFNDGAAESQIGGSASTAPVSLVYTVKAGKVTVYPAGNGLRFYKILFSETDPASSEEGGSGVPDYDPVTGFEW